jgi:hypothetical protein
MPPMTVPFGGELACLNPHDVDIDGRGRNNPIMTRATSHDGQYSVEQLAKNQDLAIPADIEGSSDAGCPLCRAWVRSNRLRQPQLSLGKDPTASWKSGPVAGFQAIAVTW